MAKPPSARRADNNAQSLPVHLGLTENKSASATKLQWGWATRISSPERAILEALDELPEQESFHNLDKVFEGLATLSPRRLAALLNSSWRERLKAEEFELGAGDRALVKGGRIHPRYRIMVPPEFVREARETDGP